MKNITGVERRFPRESLTKKLVRICRRLDENPEEVITWKSLYFQEKYCNRVSILNLWVVGSYARGSLNCGDLDLVINFTAQAKARPGAKDVSKGFFGRMQYTSFFEGTPENNSSNVVFKDAVEIWSGPGCDWKGSIKSIIPDSTAGRFYRPSDILPLRANQLNTTFDHIDGYVQMLNDGLLESEYIPLSAGLLEALTDEAKLEMLANNTYPTLGSATQRILPAIFRVVSKADPFLSFRILDKSELRCGGTNVLVGKPYLPHREAFNDLSLRQVALVPHLTAKGPNGVWFLRRGPNHPLVRLFNNKRAHVLTCNGKPDYMMECPMESSDSSLCSIRIFTEEKFANMAINSHKEDYEDLSELISCKEYSGKHLHDVISGCDFIEVDDIGYSINNMAEVNMNVEKCNADQIATLFPVLN